MERIRETLRQLRESGNFRTIPGRHRSGIVDFTSNDYLGLAADTALQREFYRSEQAEEIPLTSSASRLLSAVQEQYYLLESELGALYGRSALLFNSGYHANTGLIPALADSSTLIVADKLVHASAIDGYKLSDATLARFRHNDLDHLESILSRRARDFSRVLIVVESVYSMDGDAPDMVRLAELKRATPGAMLYVDEAHAFGAVGPSGLGLAMEAGVADDVDVLVGTLGKAAASSGAFAVMSDELRDYAVNRARSFIFSTALPPLCCAWTRFLLRRIVGMEESRRHLAALGKRLASHLAGIGDGPVISDSHIQPFIVGSAHRALELSGRLEELGLKVLPIRTPTVPAGTERLRISLSAAMTMDDIDRLGDALKGIRL